MDNFVEFLKTLKACGLLSTHDKLMAKLVDMKAILNSVCDDVNDKALDLMTSGDYEFARKVLLVPDLCADIIKKLDDCLNETKVSEESIVVESSGNAIIEEDLLPYKDIITSVKGLKVGSKLTHISFGVGEIKSFVEKDGRILMTVLFECGEKIFNCTDDVLSKYRGITCNSVNDFISVNDILESDVTGKKFNGLMVGKCILDATSWRDCIEKVVIYLQSKYENDYIVSKIKFLHKNKSDVIYSDVKFLKEINGVWLRYNLNAIDVLRYLKLLQTICAEDIMLKYS